MQAIAPASALKLEEKAWNAYPRCKTVLSNPFLGDRFELTIETIHLADAGTTENVSWHEGPPRRGWGENALVLTRHGFV